MVVVQIESRAGVDNVEEIAKVDGLDVLFIGEFFFCYISNKILKTACSLSFFFSSSLFWQDHSTLLNRLALCEAETSTRQ